MGKKFIDHMATKRYELPQIGDAFSKAITNGFRFESDT